MKNSIILFLFYYIIGTNALNCSNANGIYENPDDYQSFYNCNNYCPSLEYCKPPNPYFISNIQGCSSEPNNWLPRYYLSGTKVLLDGSGTTLYVRQDGYQLLWTSDDRITSNTFTGQYINETHARGIHVRRLLTTNCINVFDVQVIASADRQFCAFHKLHPQSATCDFNYPYDYTYCQTLSY
jgi:hypothetical protein